MFEEYWKKQSGQIITYQVSGLPIATIIQFFARTVYNGGHKV